MDETGLFKREIKDTLHIIESRLTWKDLGEENSSTKNRFPSPLQLLRSPQSMSRWEVVNSNSLSLDDI